ncbi:MAG TPA: GAF domain-containing protein [Frankiaceae bacterium]|nr:GAF domain-containing protein [Frankiaceae bacterium]
MSSVLSTAGTRPRDESQSAPEQRARSLASAATPVRPGPDTNDLLIDAARLSRQALGADHASILLTDPRGRLVPTVSVARKDDQLLWSRFRAMPPLRLDTVPLDRTILTGSRPIVINDVESSAIVPAGWRNAFDIRSAAIAPLVVEGEVRGALVVDYSGVHHEFTEAEVRLLEAMASPIRYLLGVDDVVEAAGRRQALLDVVCAAGRDLAAARTRHEVLQTGMDAVVAVLGATSCSVNVVADDGTIDTLASRGPRQPEPGRHAPGDAAVPGAQRVPMAESPAAYLLVGRDPLSAPHPGDLDVARALAAQTWQAYERAVETARLDRRIEFLEAVYALAEDALLDSDMEQLLQRLAPVVRATSGAELIDAFLADTAAARAFATPTPNRQLAALIRRWRREPELRPVVVNDLLVVPMVVEDQVLGVLRVRPGTPAEPDAEHLVLAVASGIAGVVARVLLRKRMAENERGLAVAEERERVGRDLHDTLGQQLFALRVELDAIAATVTDKGVAARLHSTVSAVSRANADLRLAIHALSFLEHAKRGLVPSLRMLVRKISDTTDIGLQLRVVGAPVRLNHGCEEALFRVAHEALANVVRHSRASTATLTISFSPERTSLIVRDDGTGMSARSDEQRGLHFGLRTMQRRMEEIGGGLDVSNFRPHGVCLHAWVPTR